MLALNAQKTSCLRICFAVILAACCLTPHPVRGQEGTAEVAEAAEPAPQVAAQDRVVLLFFEGFAPSLLFAADTPHFDRMRDEGVFTHRLHSVFPTQAWVNGASLETGCWPEQHGILADRFVDPERGRFDREALRGWLRACEDLATVARRQGVTVTRFGGFGFDAESTPERCDTGARRRDVARRRALLDHLGTAADTRELVVARFCDPARVIRGEGVDTPKSVEAVVEIDAFLGEVIAALEGHEQASTLFVATDHGMRDVSHLIQLDRILDREGIDAEVEATGSTAFLYLAAGTDPAASAERLSKYMFFEVLRKGALPAYAHWGEGPRVPDLVVSAYPPYFIEARDQWPYWLRPLGWIAPDHLWAEGWRRATSGYVPRVPAMYGLAYVWGDGVTSGGRETQAFRVIDLHPTLAALLGIRPGEPLDGRIAASIFDAPPAPDEVAPMSSLP